MKNTKVFGISGRKRHGKDTVADIIIELMAEKNELYLKRKFGDPLKQVCSVITGIPVEGWETDEDKDKLLGPEWDSYDMYGLKVSLTRRQFMTKLGTDVGTTYFHKNMWINPTLRGITESTNVIFSDVRFFPELDVVRNRNGVLIRVTNPHKPKDGTHSSETLMDQFEGWDFQVLNDGTREQLKHKIRIILISLGML